MSVDIHDGSIIYFIESLKQIFETETYDYSYYDFEKKEIYEKNKLYILLERINEIYNKSNKKYKTNKNRLINNTNNELNPIYYEINKHINSYEITSICNIQLGRILKYKKPISNIPIQLYEGYSYSFTVNYRKKQNENNK